MKERNYPSKAPAPRLSESPEAVPPNSAKSGWIAVRQVLIALVSAVIGYVFGTFGVIVVSGICSYLFLRMFYRAARGDFGGDGLLFVLTFAIIPLTLLVLLPAWIGYAIGALTSL